MRKFGLIGFPLSHSFSPAYFANKFATEGIFNCSYESYPIEDIQLFTSLIHGNPELEGLNVTIPYKKSIIPFLNKCSDAVTKIAACNCIKIKNSQLTGHNTDVIGFEKSLAEKLTSSHKNALVLGTGGSAAAVQFVLEKLGIKFINVSRTANSSGNITYNDLSEALITKHTLIINTTPLGMFPNVNDYPPIPYQHINSTHYLFDLVYNPVETVFLKKGAVQGALVKNGADMLIIQAEESWKIWNDDSAQ